MGTEAAHRRRCRRPAPGSRGAREDPTGDPVHAVRRDARVSALGIDTGGQTCAGIRSEVRLDVVTPQLARSGVTVSVSARPARSPSGA